MYSPLVSVIIPNYNHALFLDKRIQSVLNQTYQNFEVIILDDKSTDNSLEIIKKYQDNSHVTHIVRNEVNSGSTFKQWNKGFELAKGEWIWIAESDDYCECDFLKCLMKEIEEHSDVVIAYYKSQLIDETGAIIQIAPQNSFKVDFFNGIFFIRTRMIERNAICNASSAIFKKEKIWSIDKHYEDYVAAGDKLFWIELAERGNVIYISSPKNFFRQHENKVSPLKNRQGVTSKEDFKIVRYLEERGYVNFFRRIYVRAFNLDIIKNNTFDNSNIRHELQLLWSYNGLIPLGFMSIYKSLYEKITLYHSLFIYELNKISGKG